MKTYLTLAWLLLFTTFSYAQGTCQFGYPNATLSHTADITAGVVFCFKMTVSDTSILKSFHFRGGGSQDSVRMGIYTYRPDNRIGTFIAESAIGVIDTGSNSLSALTKKLVFPFDYYLCLTTKGVQSGQDLYFDTINRGESIRAFTGPFTMPSSNATGSKFINSPTPHHWIETECCPRGDTLSVSACNNYTSTITGKTYTQSGFYIDTVMASSYQYCDSMVVLDVDLFEPTVSQTNNLTLVATDSGATYQWVDCDNAYQAVAGATGPSFSDSIGGNFAVVVTKSGCSDTSSCYSIDGLNITENPFAGMAVYPNPTDGILFIELGENKPEEVEISLYTITGKKLSIDKMATDKGWQISLPEQSGLYILKVGQGGFGKSMKVMRM